MSVNKVILIGNLGQEPSMRYFQDGSAVCNFSVATSEKWTDKASGEKKEKTEWHRVTVFRKLAEICGQYLGKGSKVYVEGKLQTRSYDKDGQQVYVTEIVASEVQFLDPNGQGRQGQQTRTQPGGYQAQGGYQQQGGYSQGSQDDGVPF